ncbi:MAG TPA: chromosomal replication initiator protein DnaA [Candidatus Eremiobacteraeota bacterium]|nr:MAG: Chromosomal replication initiator protein DnaA [bacterium ADurb.Bin363]HPZ09390.1 chromosomal replication initiator protein DnaA [Candidatus Eremiobacteraeota bacterium]
MQDINDNSDNINEIWKKTISILEEKIGTPTFETCLKNSRVVSFEENNLVIGVPSKFAKSWLEERNHKKLIETTLTTVSGKKFGLSFIILPSTIPQKIPQKVVIEKNQTVINKIKKTANNRNLNPKYTFSTFVVGNSNSLAHAASLAVSESPAKVYNPLFIYGGVGLGKTHLMHAVGHQAISLRPELHVTYISAETFTNEMIEAIQTRQTKSFRNRYRTVDILLIDDIQFLISKEGIQEEFFHTFNDLHSADKQIIITSDRPPKEIPTLQDRLKSRFEWGLIADIQPPNLETRQAILRKKAELENMHIPNNVIEYIAEIITSNIRELEGVLVRIMAYASLKKARIDLFLAKEAIENLVSNTKKDTITVPLILKKTADYFAVSLDDLCSGGREQKLARARQIAMFLARELTGTSYPEIGKHFGGKDHTTILHAYNKIKEENDPAVKAHINNIKNELSQLKE